METIMKFVKPLVFIFIITALVSCGKRIRGKYECFFNCYCADRNIVYTFNFIDSRRVTISNGVDEKTTRYKLRGSRIEIEPAGAIQDEGKNTFTIINDYTMVVMGKNCLSGTYRKIF